MSLNHTLTAHREQSWSQDRRPLPPSIEHDRSREPDPPPSLGANLSLDIRPGRARGRAKATVRCSGKPIFVERCA